MWLLKGQATLAVLDTALLTRKELSFAGANMTHGSEFIDASVARSSLRHNAG
jgi:hypothetical protein